MASGKGFKESYGASVEFKGGMVDPDHVKIVGLDIPVEDWNQDIHDEDRLVATIEYMTTAKAKAGIQAMIEFGCSDPVKVVKRRDMVLVVDGRTKTLSARAANNLLREQGQPYGLEIPIVVDKNDDQMITMRMANAYRREDPPWVKARQAAQMRRSGKSDKQIGLLSGGVEVITLKNWEAYMLCVPEIQRLVEHPAPGQDRLPFAVAFELGKIGKGETKRQLLALECLHNMGAQLTGEIGRANVKAVVERIVSGEMTQAPPGPGVGAAFPAQTKDFEVASGGAEDEATGLDHAGPKAPTKRTPRATDPVDENRPIVLGIQRPKPSQLNSIVAMLEPTKDDPHTENDIKLAYAIALIYSGQDPDCEGLEDWPDIQVDFQRALGVTKAAKKLRDTKAQIKAAKKAKGKES